MSYPNPRNRFYNARTQQYDDLESGRTSPQRTEFDWDFPTPLQRISRATSPIPILNVVSIFPGGSRVPTPEAQEPDQIPVVHPSYRQYYFEDANDEFIVSGKTMLTIQRLTFHTGRRILFSRLSFPLRLTNDFIPEKQMELSHSVGRCNPIRVRIFVRLPLRWVRDPINLLYVPG